MGHDSRSDFPTGRHVLAELTGCAQEMLNTPAVLETCFRRCARDGGATIVSSHFHHFTPHGVSGVVVIAESHVTVHTWPELGYAAIDVFTCGIPTIAESIMDLIVASLHPSKVHRVSLTREPHRHPEKINPCP